MRNLGLILGIVLSSFSALKAQNDTLLYNSFDSLVMFNPTQIDVASTHASNYQGWYNYSLFDLNTINIYDSLKTGSYYDETWFKKWHVIPYTVKYDTTSTNPLTIDTITSQATRSVSWFAAPQSAATVLVSPVVWISPGDAVLKWKSMPSQGPRYQDGYKVYVVADKPMFEGNFNPNDYTPVFKMKEMNSTPPPSTLDSSLAKIIAENGFIPSDGTDYTAYTLPAPTGSGKIDSSRQDVWMQEFQVSLSAYSGPVQIVFYHDSHDDVAILVDDILVTGTGAIGIEETKIDGVDFAIYPNPASTNLNLNINAQRSLSLSNVELRTIQGKVVKNFGVQNITIGSSNLSFNISDLAAGTYVLRAYSNEGIVSEMFQVKK